MRDPVLLAVLLLAAGLRLAGLGHGLPFVYNPDEANIMARALSVARGFDPEYYLYPSFFFYFVFGVMGALFVLGRLVGRYESLGAFQMRFFEDPTDFYVAGRLIGVIAALATIVVTYRLVSRHFGRTAARASSVFVAVAYFNVRDAHYLKHDVPSGLLLIVALWAIDRALTKRTLRSYLGAGVALGVAFATHYYMIFLAPAFAAVHWASRKGEHFTHVLYAGLASAVTFFLLSPFVVLRFPVALEHMRANRQVVVDRSLDAGFSIFPSFGLYADFLVNQGLGYVLVLLAVSGLVLMFREGAVRLALWVVFPALFFAFITYTFFAGRYLNPVLPCMAAAAGLAVSGLEKRLGATAAAVVTVLACVQPVYCSIQVDRLFVRDDTRTIARRWIVENLPAGETLALQSYSVPVPQSAASFRESLEANGALSELDRGGKYASLLAVAQKESVAYRLVFFGKGDELNRVYVGYEELGDGLEPLQARGVRHVVLRDPPVPPPPAVSRLFQRVAAEGTLLRVVSPFPADRPGEITPYLDNEDWPPDAALSHKGPRITIWSLGSP